MHQGALRQREDWYSITYTINKKPGIIPTSISYLLEDVNNILKRGICENYEDIPGSDDKIFIGWKLK